MMAQKRWTLPKYQKIVLNRIKASNGD